jgi:diaminohydroxyphosphoribosylaminopyrimidine deaminase/5-amino-6-(5-phosphoribosylamino)uracil reductase
LSNAQVGRVVVACLDPNPVASGGAFELREAGIRVDIGVLHDQAEEVNRVFLTAHRTGRSFVCLKVATSLDGFMAPLKGPSGPITGAMARREGRRLRAEMGCVLVGRGTVVEDDPRLTARVKGVVNEPLRLIVDPFRRLSGQERVFQQPGRAVRAVCQELAQPGDWPVPAEDGQIRPTHLVRNALASGVTGILVEGGPRTVSAFLRDGTVDQIEWFVSPDRLGSGRRFDLSDWSGGPWRWKRPRLLGRDLWLRAVRS